MNCLRSLLLVSLAIAPHAPAAVTDIPVTDHVVVQRCVIDGPSARMIAVGFPGGFNYAFDAQNCAPVYTWSGGFVDFSGETLARGGRKCAILGTKQPLGTAINPLRRGSPDVLPQSLVFKGYRRESGTKEPTFLFEIDGYPVEQAIKSTDANTVQLNLYFPIGDTQTRYYHIDASQHERVALSDGLRWATPGVVAIPGRLESATLTIRLKPAETPFARKQEKLTGQKIYQYYCKACHSDDGTKLIGPSFKDLWGSQREITRNGETHTVFADADYIRESVANPQASVVKGYEAVPMPSFATILSEDDIETLVEYFRDGP